MPHLSQYFNFVQLFRRLTAHTPVKTCHQKSRFSRAKNQKVRRNKQLQQQRAVDQWKQFHKRFSMGKMTWKKGTGMSTCLILVVS